MPWKAAEIRVENVSCRKARRLIRRYAKPRDCQFQERCRVRRWVCRTYRPNGNKFDERCTRGRRVVRWDATYTSS